jgi:hypothetical protein
MAYDIGERVESRFLGKGVVIGEIFKVDTDENGRGGTALQRVRFDNPAVGEKDYEIRRLVPVEDGGDIGA